MHGNGPHLMAKDDARPGLAADTDGDRDLVGKSGCATLRSNWTDSQHLPAVERLVGNDQRPALATLLVTRHRLEVDDDDRPAQRR